MLGSEEIFVDAVEVVSFGQSFFYRGQERPKPFLVPVSDYEVFEVKETRVVLKNITHDRNIKIGGGREASLKPAKEIVPVEKKEEIEEVKESLELATPVEATIDPKSDRKRDRRRSRRRRIAEEKKGDGEKDKPQDLQENASLEDRQVDDQDDEVEVPRLIPTFNQILPPPTVLISERLNQLRAQEMAKGLLVEGTLEGAEVESSEEISTDEPREDSSKDHAKVNSEEEEEDFNF